MKSLRDPLRGEGERYILLVPQVKTKSIFFALGATLMIRLESGWRSTVKTCMLRRVEHKDKRRKRKRKPRKLRAVVLSHHNLNSNDAAQSHFGFPWFA